MRNSGQNRPRGDAQGPRPNNHRNRRGRNRHRHPQGEQQGPPPQGKRNRRRKPQEGFRNRENRPPRRRKQHPMREHFAHRNRMRQDFDRGSPFQQRRRDVFKPAAGFTSYDDRIEVIVELPGVEEKDISVSVARKMLLVKGKKHQKQTE